MERHREEVLNVYLAECLRDLGAHAAGEQIEITHSKRALPDVLVTYMGLRCMIEGKFDDHTQAASEVMRNAMARVETGIAHIAVGVVYSSDLRSVAQSEIKEQLRHVRVRFCICTETHYTEPEWHEGDARNILDLIRRGHTDLVENDIVERSVSRLREGMSDLIRVLDTQSVAAERIASILGVPLKAENAETSEPDDE